MDWDVKEAELRAGGWSDSEIRDFRRGWESVDDPAGRSVLSVAAPEPAPRVSVRDGLPSQGGRNLDYEKWRRTPAGRIHSLAYPNPADAYAEQHAAAGSAASQEVRDWWETSYGAREITALEEGGRKVMSPVEIARASLHSRGWQRGGWAGTARELQDATRWTFPDFVIRDRGEELPASDQVHMFPQTPEGVAAMCEASLEPRR